MAWARSYQRTTKPEPYDSVLFCGICGIEVDVTRDREIYVPQRADRNAEYHLATYHRLRYWLWRQVGWRWLVGGLR